MASGAVTANVKPAQAMLTSMAAVAGNQERVLERPARNAQRKTQPTHADRTGALSESLRGGKDQLKDVYDSGFRLGSQVPYAHYVLYGTSHNRAFPVVVPENEIAAEVAQAVARSFRAF